MPFLMALISLCICACDGARAPGDGRVKYGEVYIHSDDRYGEYLIVEVPYRSSDDGGDAWARGKIYQTMSSLDGKTSAYSRSYDHKKIVCIVISVGKDYKYGAVFDNRSGAAIARTNEKSSQLYLYRKPVTIDRNYTGSATKYFFIWNIIDQDRKYRSEKNEGQSK